MILFYPAFVNLSIFADDISNSLFLNLTNTHLHFMIYNFDNDSIAAASNGHCECVRLLLENNSKVNKQFK